MPDPSPAPAGFATRLKHYLITGLFVTVPVGLTLVTMVWFVRFIDGSVSPVVDAATGRHVPGLGLLSAFFVVLATGWLASNVVGQTLLEWGERLLLLIPGFNWIYRTIKQIIEAFSPENQVAFRRVVVVEYPRAGAYSVGFVTKELDMDWGGGRSDEMLAVYIPTNHFYLGDYVLFKRSDVHATHLTVQEGIQVVLSAGAAIPDRLRPSAAK